MAYWLVSGPEIIFEITARVRPQATEGAICLGLPIFTLCRADLRCSGAQRSSHVNMKMDYWDIYHNYYGRVKKFIFAIVKDEWAADDLIQETFIKVQKNLNQLREEARLSSWIFRIAYNLCQDHYRKINQAAEREQDSAEERQFLSEPLFQKEFEQHQMGACVQDKIRLLPESYQVVLVLFDLMEFRHQEIAEILEISVENVKVRLHRARKKLKAILEKECRFEVDERNVLICDPVASKNKKL
jgi:RNA polymerase sigma-70 factor (ECF subfamily)